MRLPRLLFAVLAFVSAVACSTQAGIVPSLLGPAGTRIFATPPPHGVLPLRVNQADKAGWNLRLTIARGPSQPFLFDTGSAGLWAYFNAFGSSKNYTSTGQRVKNTYSSGIIYEGTVVYAPVGFERGYSAKSVPIVLVDVARCKTKGCPAELTLQNCPNVFKNPPKAHPAIFCLEEGRGLWGTFGADLEPTIVATPAPPAKPIVLYNALFAIAPWSSEFVVTPHELELGPNPLAIESFIDTAMDPKAIPTALPNGARGWKRDVTLCYTVGRFAHNYCTATLFDTGAHDIHFETAAPFVIPTQAADCGYVLRNRAFSLAKRNGTTIASFQTGYSTDYNAVRLATPKPRSTPEINTGLTFYNRDEILFDARGGRVGLHPLAAPGHLARRGCNG